MTDDTHLLTLQNQLAQMQAQIEALESEKQSWQTEKEAFKEDKVEMQTRIDHLLAELKLSKSQKYGRKSEKAPRGTFNEAEQHKTSEAPQHHKKGKQLLAEHFEREEVEHTLTELACTCCGEQMHHCGSEDSEQVKIIPAKISVIKHKQFKYACRHCEHEELSSKIITAPKPAQPIPGSMASPEALSAVVTAKYCDALPLYRLVDIFERGGLSLSRGTLANWCIKAGNLIKPLVKAMQRHLLGEHSLCADETRVQVLDEGENPSSNSQMWVYRSNEVSKQVVVIYDYQAGRSRACAEEFLAGYQGYLQCDGYSVYEGIEGVIPVGCWAHARRKYDEALKAESKNKGRAHKAISFISQLYKIETQAKNKKLSPQARYQLRQEKALPILTKFKVWLDETSDKVTAGSYIGKAIKYNVNQWHKLIRYVEDGHLGIDNNITERDIRPFTTGRKNWLFSKSINGAQASATLYSIVMTCRANDINPYYYFQHLFKILPARQSDDDDFTDLMPWNVQLDFDYS
ncbi:MAG: IS66 family transposase [Litorilituus sp.]|jgi:transposase|nr:IS66 family transposase [Litorilituus sp.]